MRLEFDSASLLPSRYHMVDKNSSMLQKRSLNDKNIFSRAVVIENKRVTSEDHFQVKSLFIFMLHQYRLLIYYASTYFELYDFHLIFAPESFLSFDVHSASVKICVAKQAFIFENDFL